MKLIRSFILVFAGLAAPSAQAGVVSDLRLTFDWGSLKISGATMTPYIDPDDGDSSVTYAFLGYGEPFTPLNYPEIFEGSISKMYSDAEVNVSSGYNELTNQSSVHVQVDNNHAPVRTGYAETGRGLYYQAGATGEVTFEIEYSLFGFASIEEKNNSEYINASYDYALGVVDDILYEEVFDRVFDEQLLLNGGDIDAAENAADDAAEAVAGIAYEGGLSGDENSFISVLELYSGCDENDCNSSVDGGGVLSITFDVEKDGLYTFEARGAVTSYSVVPVPAAVWLFASSLLGLVGVNRMRKS